MPTTEFDYEPGVTMRELYQRAGFDPDRLVHPKDISADDIVEGTVVVAYTTVRNPDIDGPATTRGFVEWEIGPEDVFATDEVAEATDGTVSFPDDTPIPHAVKWGVRGGVPMFESIGYGDEFYDSDPKFEDPNRWERTAGNVTSHPDDFFRFRLPQEDA